MTKAKPKLIPYSSNEVLRLKSGWPVSYQITYGNKSHIIKFRMKEDMQIFNVSDRDLASESNISHQRIYNIKQCYGSPASLKEISILSLAFNRILDKRTNTGYKIEVFIENNLLDNQ